MIVIYILFALAILLLLSYVSSIFKRHNWHVDSLSYVDIEFIDIYKRKNYLVSPLIFNKVCLVHMISKCNFLSLEFL